MVTRMKAARVAREVRAAAVTMMLAVYHSPLAVFPGKHDESSAGGNDDSNTRSGGDNDDFESGANDVGSDCNDGENDDTGSAPIILQKYATR